MVPFVHLDVLAMRFEDEEDPKKPRPVRSSKKRGGYIPVESDDEGKDRHRHL